MIVRTLEAIRSAESSGLVSTIDESVLTGFSGRKLIGALQRLAHQWEHDQNACYLEIGVFQGLTLLSVAAACPSLPCYGIDNFAFFDPQGKNLELVLERRAKLGAINAGVINLDYEDALEHLAAHVAGRKVAVFFVDGPHDYRSQRMCLELALPHLHDNAVVIIDDCSYPHVRQANRDFLVTHPEYALLFEAYTSRHPDNMTESENASARAGWWNGVNIITRDSAHAITRSYPPTFRSRQLYEMEHFLHAARAAPHAVRALEVAQFLDERNWRGLAHAVVRLERDLKSTRKDRQSRFRWLNTYSDGLPTSRYCTFRELVCSGSDANAPAIPGASG